MAIKAIAQISGQFTLDGSGDISIPVYIKSVAGDDGVFTYGPVAPNQCTEANIVAWVKDTADNFLSVEVGPLDTVKLVSGIGGAL